MKQLLIATTSPGKRREMVEGLRDLPVEIITLADLLGLTPCVEDGATFMENARKKARHYHERTGLFTLADDSGLEVDALNGEPGVFSARFAGEGAPDAAHIRKLLDRLRGIPPSRRTARFVCALSAYDGQREIFAGEARAEGLITEAPRGDQGFGYDPVFLVPELGRTFAELSPGEKPRHSHRGKALAAARPVLRNYLDKPSPDALQ